MEEEGENQGEGREERRKRKRTGKIRKLRIVRRKGGEEVGR